MKYICSAPGKLVIIGDYAVLWGAPALVAAYNRYAVAEISETQHPHFALSARTLSIDKIHFKIENGKIRFLSPLSAKQKNDLRFFIAIFEFVYGEARRRQTTIPPLYINLNTTDFFEPESGHKLGLGSSAAITVALTAGLAPLLPQAVAKTKPDLFRFAMATHRAAQQNVGSGIDIAAAIFGGIIRYQKDAFSTDKDVPEKVLLPPDLLIQPVWTGFSVSTTEMVKTVDKWHAAEPQKSANLRNRLEQLSEAGCNAFRDQKTADFLKIIDDYYQTLHEITISSQANIISEAHAEIFRIVKKYGYAYKPSGAGGGDFGLIFSREPLMAPELFKELHAHGFKIIDLQIAPEGIKLKN